MSRDEHIRRAILELIAFDPDGDWDIASLCTHIYGRSDQYYVIRRAIRDMMLPGTWRLGWRKKSSRLYDPCSDARLADLERRIEQFENKGWHERRGMQERARKASRVGSRSRRKVRSCRCFLHQMAGFAPKDSQDVASDHQLLIRLLSQAAVVQGCAD